jgi:lipoprotein-anchoring transpeptidase ErfK/SrfK
VDLTEQVLTAYEGDEWVFATLVSTGVPETPTTPGIHRVWYKTWHERMHGDGYDVEEVPFIQYFHRGEALHGAFWHDQFGTPRTHGCVNLSPADARWLFQWAKPAMPIGWHSLLVNAATEPLWVVIERPKRRATEMEAVMQSSLAQSP